MECFTNQSGVSSNRRHEKCFLLGREPARTGIEQSDI